jgi:hypothetical protein
MHGMERESNNNIRELIERNHGWNPLYSNAVRVRWECTSRPADIYIPAKNARPTVPGPA